MPLGPACPRCRHTVPFARAQFGRGRSFTCNGCGAAIVIPKTGALLAIGAFAGMSIIAKSMGSLGAALAVIAPLFVGALVVEWLLAPVRLAKNSSDTNAAPAVEKS